MVETSGNHETTAPYPRATTAPSGYRSEEARRRYTRKVAILAVVFGLAQLVIPFAIMLVAMLVFMSSAMFPAVARPDSGAYWDGRAWYVAEKDSPFRSGTQGSVLELYSLTPGSKEGPRKVAELPGAKAALLAGSDRLWIVLERGTGYYRDGQLTVLPSAGTPEFASRPFLCGGRPAVLEFSLDGISIDVLDGEKWSRGTPVAPASWLDEIGTMNGIRLVEAGAEIHSFAQSKAGLVHKKGMPDGSLGSWQMVSGPDTAHWAVLALDGRPAVLISRENAVIGKRYEDGVWREFFTYSTLPYGELGAFPGKTPDGFYLLLRSFPERIKLVEVRGDRVAGETAHGDGFPFPRPFMLLCTVPNVIIVFVVLLLAHLLTRQMRKFRGCEYGEGPNRCRFASLWRRGLACLVDYLILAAPCIVPGAMMFSKFGDPEKMLNPAWMVNVMLLSLGCLVWILLGFLVLSAMEGRGGQTPGKRLLGIRVVGIDLRPCGFGRALVRNLLRVVDSMFSYMVGILMVALTDKWQRLGDMVAKTVVIRCHSAHRTGRPPREP
jgi:uncharacterized RDD family membrane protein YckC